MSSLSRHLCPHQQPHRNSLPPMTSSRRSLRVLGLRVLHEIPRPVRLRSGQALLGMTSRSMFESCSLNETGLIPVQPTHISLLI